MIRALLGRRGVGLPALAPHVARDPAYLSV